MLIDFECVGGYVLGRENSKGRKPEVEVCLLCWRIIKRSVCLEQSGREVGEGVRNITGS